MPLPLPNLDDRRWADLVDEGRALIPHYAPKWTDHNIHDPGITLMELFAWLTEMTVYRLNRIPERHLRKFLSLIGFNPISPRSAQTILTFTPDAGTAPFELPKGVAYEATDADGQIIRFRTLRDVIIAVVELSAVKVQELNEKGESTIRDRTRDWLDGLPVEPMGANPLPDAALYLGFSVLPTNVPIAIAFHFQGPGNGATERRRIVNEATAQRAACRPVLPAIDCAGSDTASDQTMETLLLHHSVRVIWEVLTGVDPEVWTPLQPLITPSTPEVGQVMDDTRALTLDGIVEINVPTTIVRKSDKDPLFYLRCRLTQGAYDAVAVLLDLAPNSVIAEQAVAVFQQFTIAPDVLPEGPIPVPGNTARLKMRMDVNGVIENIAFFKPEDAPGYPDILVLDFKAPKDGKEGHITLEMAMVGRGDDQANQQLSLPEAPVHAESLLLYTHDGEAWDEWTRRNDLDASSRTDRHFVVEETNGQIHFGDGERGRIPSESTFILVSYRSTRAEAGNVFANTVTKLSVTPLNQVLLADLPNDIQIQLFRITGNHISASGGAAKETLASAIGRGFETVHAHERLLELCAESKCRSLDQIDRGRIRSLRAPTRAVNLVDIERLALDVPGTQIARTRAWSGIHPDYPCLEASGVVTIGIVPDMPTAKPEPSQGLLDAVRRYLGRRRIVTTRLEVVGPQYLEVHVAVQIRTQPHTDLIRVRERIDDALNAFLDPRSGGPNNQGWPFGRDVYRSEILQLIDNVLGVDHVLELSLNAGSDEPQCGNLNVCPTWLVTSGDHNIEVTRGEI